MSKGNIIRVLIVVAILVVGLAFLYWDMTSNDDEDTSLRFKVVNDTDDEFKATFHIDDQYDGYIYVKPHESEWYSDKHCKAGEMHDVWFAYKVIGGTVWHSRIFDTDRDVSITVMGEDWIVVKNL